MARISNKDKALAYATDKGIILTVEDDMSVFDPDSNEVNVWLCECCALMVNNGDDSSCRDFHGHTHPTCDKSVIYANTEDTFEVGYFHANCNGCGAIVRTGGTLHAAIRQTN